IDAKAVVSRAVFIDVTWLGCGRGHPDRWNFFIFWTAQPNQRAAVIVTMKQELGTFGRQYVAQLCSIFQAPKIAPQRTDRRMVDQDRAKISACLLQGFGQSRELLLAKTPGTHEVPG